MGGEGGGGARAGGVSAAKRPGVVYLSRLPPFLKPLKVRQMLEKHGELGRVYLAPEDPAINKRRKREGRPTGKSFTEGWVEFVDKRVAKRVAGELNGQPMGGKRRSRYYHDLWSMKYLHKFKWDFLTEEIRQRGKIREQRLAAEISAAKKEKEFYLSRVDQATGLEAMQERRAQREREGKGGAGERARGKADKKATQMKASQQKIVRKFRQRDSKPDPGAAGAKRVSEGLLGLVAGKR